MKKKKFTKTRNKKKEDLEIEKKSTKSTKVKQRTKKVKENVKENVQLTGPQVVMAACVCLCVE